VAFEAREKARASIGRVLRGLADEADGVIVVTEGARPFGLTVRNPRSAGAERVRQIRDRGSTVQTQLVSTVQTDGASPSVPLSPTPPFPSSSPSTAKHPVAPQKPKRSRKLALDAEDPFTAPTLAVVDAVDALLRTRDPEHKGYPRTVKSTEHIRARLAERGVTVADLILLVEWWGNGQERFTDAAGRVWDPWDHLDLAKPFIGGKFAGRLSRARQWRSRNGARSASDRPRAGDVDPDDFQRRLVEA